ncbi:MAG: hypothetical protein HW403_728 [Dehalococcoidia bacterium]|nr:hypothetical protein [Dehalococcoidia bacterium]
MNRKNCVRSLAALGILALVAAPLLSGLGVRAHQDPPGPPSIDDQVNITEMIAKTDQDDGPNGESEYCLRVSWTHTEAHPIVSGEWFNCQNINWDDPNPANNNTPFDEGSAPRLPLIGSNGYMANQVLGPRHHECVSSAYWKIDAYLYESDDSDAGEIIAEIGQAVQELSGLAPPGLQARVVLAGRAVERIGRILDRVFANMTDNLGHLLLDWDPGSGDPSGTVQKTGSLAHFNGRAEKNVQKISDIDCLAASTFVGVQPSTFGQDPDHWFGRAVAYAAPRWNALRGAAGRIDNVRGESTGAPNEALRTDLRDLAGSIARTVADNEVVEGEANPGRVPASTIAEAKTLLAQGDALLETGVGLGRTSDLIKAITSYQQAFEMVTPLLHPEFALLAKPTGPLGSPDAVPVTQSLGPTRLSWESAQSVRQFHVQATPLSNDGPGIDLIISDAALVKGNEYTIQPPVFGQGNYVVLPGAYYSWQVRHSTAETAIGPADSSWGPWSELQWFRTPAATSETIQLQQPIRDSTVADLTPTVRWTDSNRQVFYYEVLLSKDPNFCIGSNSSALGVTLTCEPSTAVFWNLIHGGESNPANSWTIPEQFRLEPGIYYTTVRPRLQATPKGDAEMGVPWIPVTTFRVVSP